MRHDKLHRPSPQEHDSPDDIEIIEIVGLDEDGAPIAESDPEDVEVVFETGSPPEESDAEAALRERILRLQADFENFRKRSDRERFEHFRHATSALLGRILPVIDNLDRALAAVRPGSGDDALLAGLVLIQRQLVVELEAEGLRAMESVGELFDPIRHEAVATDSESPLPPHTVSEVFQRGYFLHDRVLRPALVRVRVDASGDVNGPDDLKES